MVGYTHLGARIVEHLHDAKAPYVLVDQDPAAVDDLVHIGEPGVVGNAKQEKAREKNAEAHIIVRCYVDDFAEILETLGANEVISSSKSAFEGIASRRNKQIGTRLGILTFGFGQKVTGRGIAP